MCGNPTCSLSSKGMEGKCYSIIDNTGNARISICFIKGKNLHYKQKEFPNKGCQLKFWLWFEFSLVRTNIFSFYLIPPKEKKKNLWFAFWKPHYNWFLLFVFFLKNYFLHFFLYLPVAHLLIFNNGWKYHWIT